MSLTFLKIDINFFQNPKIQRIMREAGGDTYIKIYFAILTMAMKSHAPGLIMISENMAADEADIAHYCQATEQQVRTALRVFEKMHMIEKQNGTLLIPSFEEHQRLDKVRIANQKTRERMLKYREKQRLLTCVTRNDTVTGDVTNEKVTLQTLDLDSRHKTKDKEEDNKDAEAAGADAPIAPESSDSLFSRLLKIRKDTNTLPPPPVKVGGKLSYNRAHGELYGLRARAELTGLEKSEGLDAATEVFAFAARDKWLSQRPVVPSRYMEYKTAYMAKHPGPASDDMAWASEAFKNHEKEKESQNGIN